MGCVSTWMGDCFSAQLDGSVARASRPKPLLTLFDVDANYCIESCVGFSSHLQMTRMLKLNMKSSPSAAVTILLLLFPLLLALGDILQHFQRQSTIKRN